MSTLGSFIWSIADQLRGHHRPNPYGNVILPLTILPASRQAHAEDIANLAGAGTSVTALVARR